MNKVLIIGCGSIGIRHIRILKTLKGYDIFALRTYRGQRKELPLDIRKEVTELFSEKEAMRLNPSHVIISNPTSLHLEYIKKFIRTKVKIFVEKPLSDNLAAIRNLDRVTLEKIKKHRGVVGFHLRFHTIFKKIKKLILDEGWGKPIYANLNVGHFLPYWHTYEDYRYSYAARKELGGGVLRTLAHELDLVYYLFGKIKTVFAKVERISNLEINVDDCDDIVFGTERCKRVIVHIDYLWPSLRREGAVLFEKGLLEYDYFTGRLYKTEYGKQRNLLFRLPSGYDYNQQYRSQMREFLSDTSRTGCSFREGIENLKIIDLCEQSQNAGRELCLA